MFTQPLPTVFGLFAMGFSIWAALADKKRSALQLIAMGYILWAISFSLYNAYSGAISSIIAGAEVVTANIIGNKSITTGKKFRLRHAWPFFLASIITAIIFYEKPYNLIAPLATIVMFAATLETQYISFARLRSTSLLIWVIYDTFTGAWPTAISDGFCAILTLITIVRARKKQRKPRLQGPPTA